MTQIIYFVLAFGLASLTKATTVALSDVEKRQLVHYFQAANRKTEQNHFKNTHQRIIEYGYPAETHYVYTEDEYVIKIFRIPYSHKLHNQMEAKPVVLLQHGLHSSSDSWVLLGPEDGLPFLLSDAGFDVWIGNSRGNFYGRSHTKLQDHMEEFWGFSWHEIGQYDLATIIDYIGSCKRCQKDVQRIHYVGFSQGTTALLVLLSTRSEYNDRLKSAQLLAPVAFVSHLSDPLVKVLAPLMEPGSPYASAALSKEFIPYNQLFVLLSYKVCQTTTKYTGLCSAIAYLAEGDFDSLNQTALHYLAETHPAGCSTNQLLHYMQEHRSGRFCRFDLGQQGNQLAYGLPDPPSYNLSAITAPLHLWYSDDDESSTRRDVETLAALLPNRVLHHLKYANWSHGDFILNNQLKRFLNEPIIDVLKESL